MTTRRMTKRRRDLRHRTRKPIVVMVNGRWRVIESPFSESFDRNRDAVIFCLKQNKNLRGR